MNKYLSLIILLFAACATKPVAINKTRPYVVDSADVFLPAQLHYLDSLFADHRQKKGNVIRLLTIKNFSPEKNLHDYTDSYFHGSSLAADSNEYRLLVVFCTSCDAVEMMTSRLDTQKVSARKLKTIIDSVMVPRFSRGQDYDGIANGSRAILALLNSH